MCNADLHSQTGKARKIHIDKWLTLTCRQGGLGPSRNRFCFLSLGLQRFTLSKWVLTFWHLFSQKSILRASIQFQINHEMSFLPKGILYTKNGSFSPASFQVFQVRRLLPFRRSETWVNPWPVALEMPGWRLGGAELTQVDSGDSNWIRYNFTIIYGLYTDYIYIWNM